MESHLLDGNFTSAIVSCFSNNKANAFDPNLLEPLLKALRLSPSVAASLAKAEMYAGIAHKLTHKKAVVRLNLLRLVRNIMDGCESDGSAAAAAAGSPATDKQLRILFDSIETLADKDSAVLVRNLASELVRSHIDIDMPTGRHDSMSLASIGSISGGTTGGSSSANTSGPRSRSGPRRTASYTSYTPPSLQSSMSMPPTPTHAHNHPHHHYNSNHTHKQNRGNHSYHRPSQSSSAFIEVAASPKRNSAIAAVHERDAALYRPRSRDGAGAASSATSIPRRVSGDANSFANGSVAAKSRLPRTSTALARSGAGSAGSAGGVAVVRSESSLSGREAGSGSGRYRSGSGGAAGVTAGTGGGGGGQTYSPAGSIGGGGAQQQPAGAGAGATREMSFSTGSSKRRNRAPSSDVRWS